MQRVNSFLGRIINIISNDKHFELIKRSKGQNNWPFFNSIRNLFKTELEIESQLFRSSVDQARLDGCKLVLLEQEKHELTGELGVRVFVSDTAVYHTAGLKLINGFYVKEYQSII